MWAMMGWGRDEIGVPFFREGSHDDESELHDTQAREALIYTQALAGELGGQATLGQGWATLQLTLPLLLQATVAPLLPFTCPIFVP